MCHISNKLNLIKVLGKEKFLYKSIYMYSKFLLLTKIGFKLDSKKNNKGLMEAIKSE